MTTFTGDTITFSEYGSGTAITNQYAAKGAIFSGYGGTGNPVVYDYNGGIGRILHSSDWYGALKITFVDESNSSISKPIQHFEFRNPLAEDNIIVKAYDASDNLVKSYTNFGEEDVVLNFNSPVSYVVFDDTLGTAYVIDDIYFTVAGGLPVELASFSATHTKNGILLNWNTKSETNNAGWEIEVRRFDSAQRDENSNSQKNNYTSVTLSGVEGFTKVGFVSGKGTTTESQNYQFQVETSKFQIPGLHFRLKQIDLDGKFSYSNILTVDLTPNNFGLSQNYPNPFNPGTAISYQLSAVSDVRLVVFDLLGREVATLVNKTQNAGFYTVNFDAKNLTSGLYFYSLTANGNKQTKSMILTK